MERKDYQLLLSLRVQSFFVIVFPGLIGIYLFGRDLLSLGRHRNLERYPKSSFITPSYIYGIYIIPIRNIHIHTYTCHPCVYKLMCQCTQFFRNWCYKTFGENSSFLHVQFQ